MDVSKVYYDTEGNECSIWQMVKREPTWAAVRIQEGEKALEKLTTAQAENEALRGRVAELEEAASWCEAENGDMQSLMALTRVVERGNSRPWLLRKQAEAVEALAKRFQDAADKADRADEDESDTALTLIIAKSVALKEAYQLRQQADEAERAGGER